MKDFQGGWNRTQWHKEERENNGKGRVKKSRWWEVSIEEGVWGAINNTETIPEYYVQNYYSRRFLRYKYILI